mmetsp:Transcript_30606/g.99934  ORF Transcript_30606/g.99934 Transcript_30606/m.99934 type:complete len:231 (+) Transcript_30606:607-1299(+)
MSSRPFMYEVTCLWTALAASSMNCRGGLPSIVSGVTRAASTRWDAPRAASTPNAAASCWSFLHMGFLAMSSDGTGGNRRGSNGRGSSTFRAGHCRGWSVVSVGVDLTMTFTGTSNFSSHDSSSSIGATILASWYSIVTPESPTKERSKMVAAPGESDTAGSRLPSEPKLPFFPGNPSGSAWGAKVHSSLVFPSCGVSRAAMSQDISTVVTFTESDPTAAPASRNAARALS